MIQRLSGAVLVAAAATYAVLLGPADLTFNLTPMFVGLSAICAGAAGRQARLIAVGLPLVGWGAAVLLVRNGPVPDNRQAPAYLIGLAVGLLAAHRYTQRTDVTLTGALISAIVGGLSFYLAYDWSELGRWPAWAITLAAWGMFEFVAPRRPVAPTPRR